MAQSEVVAPFIMFLGSLINIGEVKFFFLSKSLIETVWRICRNYKGNVSLIKCTGNVFGILALRHVVQV